MSDSELNKYDPRVESKSQPREKGVVTEEKLLPQIATAPEQLANQQYNDKILSKLNNVDIYLCTFIDSIPKWRGGDLWRSLSYRYRFYKRSEGGWQQNMIAKVSGNIVGAPRGSEMADKPGWFGRTFTNRDWKKKAVESGQELPPGEG